MSLPTSDFPDAEELSAKAILAKKINDIVESRGVTQVEVAGLLGMPQPKISAIRNYKLRGISLERFDAGVDGPWATCGDRRDSLADHCAGADRCCGMTRLPGSLGSFDLIAIQRS